MAKARSGSTRPSYGHPQTVLRYARTKRLCFFAAGTISPKCSSDCAMVLLVFFRLCVSLADMKTATSRRPTATARSRPARFGTSAA